MNCAKCDGPTSVLDSRLTADNFMRRRRQCDNCKTRVTTWKSTRKPGGVLWSRKNGTAAIARWREAHPEKAQRLRMREKARRIARAEGIPVAEVYGMMGCE